MRTALAIALLSLCATVASAQTLRLSFSGAPLGPTAPGQEIARRTALRAWQDSVEVFADEAARSHSGWRIVTGSARANYLVSIVAVPVAKPGYSGVAMAVVVMEPGTLVNWKYLTHYVSVVESAQQAALSLVENTISAIGDARR